MIETIVQHTADAVAWFLPFDCMNYPFMRRALLGLLLLAPLTAGTGIQVVNSRMSFFSDAIGHSAFAGVAIGLIFGWNPNWSMALLGIAVGFLIMFLKRGTRLSTDTVIGVIFSGVVAFGLAIVSRERQAARAAQTFLFGDILTIGPGDLTAFFFLLLAFLVFQFFAYNRMICIAVNPQLASVHKIHTALYQYIFAGLLSMTVIFSVRAAGVLLVTALLVVPAAAARNFAKDARGMFWIALAVSLFSTVTGLLISAQKFAATPAGTTIVLCSCAVFCVSLVCSFLRSAKTSDTEN